MTIVERMARALCVYDGVDPDFPHESRAQWTLYESESRAALRAVRAEDVSDGQLEAFTRVMPAHYLPQSKYAADLRRAIAAALAAGAET